MSTGIKSKSSARAFALAALYLASTTTKAADGPRARHGSVCVGPNRAKADHADWVARMTIKINSEGPSDFRSVPKLVVQGLALDQKHRVQILYDGKALESWTLRFKAKEGDTPRVMIWRAAGTWLMERTHSDQCVFP